MKRRLPSKALNLKRTYNGIVLILFLTLVFSLWSETTFAAPAINQRPKAFSIRGAYMQAHQNNSGRIDTALFEVGYRHWFNSKVYSSLYAGAFSFSSTTVDDDLGLNTSLLIGFNLDNLLRLEYGLSYFDWGLSMDPTLMGINRASFPIDTFQINEVFIAVGFPGNSTGATPSYILHIGIGKFL
ncbi:hypothetical protein BDW_13890 [Bdellovibrio bacteriovorus W]|nr:hypothetical protein BDW_13890 [Bdellovibrio bacteriovorus W]